ncbi:unnamed protein product [Paramecium sonneborni]|uniref:Uncharacterized protein n=1 Tax=Paramecium sonneborni TaxID=65129 RepID=A0A8S1R1G1_9CILI|nr:unnamed protein product [Paramecium sonneborni]
MLPEFSIQAVKLQANTRQPKPVKYVPPKAKSPAQKRSSSQQKTVTKAKTSTERLTRKGSEDFQETQQQQVISIEAPQQQKVIMNMDERYQYYENEAKKRQNVIDVCDGVQFYKPVKPDEMPKPPKPKKQTSKIENVKQVSRTEKSEKQSVSSDLQHSLHQSKSLYNQTTSREQQKSNSTLLEDYQTQQISVDPNFLVQGEVDGYQIDESQSQMFGFGLNDYIKNNNHKKELGEKDVAEEVKPQSESVYTYYDYYPPNANGEIPKPLLESVNYMNYLKEQQALQAQQALEGQQSQQQQQQQQSKNK